MALSSTGIWEVRSTGSDLNSGFFNPASSGTDYSQQDAAQLSLSDIVTNGTTSVTTATGGFTTAMVGNGISIAGAIYEITARTNSNSISVDRNIAAATGQSAKIGGALASPGKAAGLIASGNQVWLKGTFTISSTTANVSGGIVHLTAGGTGSSSTLQGVSKWEGYTSARGDGGRATLQASGIASVTLFTFNTSSAAYSRLVNVILDGNNQTSIRGGSGGGSGNWTYVQNCVAKNCKNGGLWNFTSIFNSEIQNCSGSSGIDNCARIINTVAFGQTGGETAIHARNGVAENCVAYNSTVAGIRVDSGGSIWNSRVYNCAQGLMAYGYIRDDIMKGCVAWGCTSRNYQNGFNSTLVQCAGGGGANNDQNAAGVIVLTSNPFMDAASGDFRLTPAATAQLMSAGMNLQSAWLSERGARRSVVL